ncbi:hypothetical protein [Nostoc sp. CHAB 5715]|uniref:hypothetical protein n=1 Tax=Nostoc sp. CHAB 5715 TaxID=2780400 RepID=UPI001E5FE566|nr:hypothetical protein [Nostoc sp. CHAB 5715]MCC5620458.1 hypothetical protein [Nostoc sp. CHAB 5715]
MGHGEEVTNAQCPMPKAAGRLSLSTHEGMEFPAAFNKYMQLDERAIIQPTINLRFLVSKNTKSCDGELA